MKEKSMKLNINQLKKMIKEQMEEISTGGRPVPADYGQPKEPVGPPKPFLVMTGHELDGVAVGVSAEEAAVKWLVDETGISEAAARKNAPHMEMHETTWVKLQSRFLDIKAEIVKKKEILTQIKNVLEGRRVAGMSEQMVATGAGVNTVAQGGPSSSGKAPVSDKK